MRRKDFEDQECSIARAVDEVCEPWTLLILRHAFIGAKRFGEFEQALEIPPNTLARRLNDLVERQLLDKVLYEAHPPRYEYRLTQRALDLLPLFVSLAVWGSRYKAPHGAPFELVDSATGRRLEPILVDRRTMKELTPGAVALAPGSGASPELRAKLKTLGKRRLVFGPERQKVAARRAR